MCREGLPLTSRRVTVTVKRLLFVTRRPDNLRDIFTVLLNKVCIDVENKPHLLPVKNEI